MTMSERKTRSSGWTYAVAALIPVLGCLIAAVIFYPGARKLPASIAEAHDLDRLAQIIVPGSADLTLSRAGAYAVYYEYHSVIGGVEHISSETPPTLECSLALKATGRVIPVVPDFVETNRYSAGMGRGKGMRAGVLIMSTTVDEPGDYTFSCRYPDGREQPKIVLAVGQNILWEDIGTLTRTAGSVLGGLAVLGGSGVVAMVIAIVIAVKRRQSKQAVVRAI
jgi:hypothetical protein